MNVQLTKDSMNYLEKLMMEYKDVFAWTYKDLKGIPLKLAQCHIELDTSIPPVHQTKYKMNPNFDVVVK